MCQGAIATDTHRTHHAGNNDSQQNRIQAYVRSGSYCQKTNSVYDRWPSCLYSLAQRSSDNRFGSTAAREGKLLHKARAIHGRFSPSFDNRDKKMWTQKRQDATNRSKSKPTGQAFESVVFAIGLRGELARVRHQRDTEIETATEAHLGWPQSTPTATQELRERLKTPVPYCSAADPIECP